jgi:prepilin-type processing-associated H-X9-DG protein/prepilin-type N-terminal cleavage/methylation domain-containing protein
MRRRKGFTLVELLVVIGIIAALIGILMPALSKARQQALTIKCASNLHSQGLALTMYTQQYSYYPGHAAFDAGTYAIWPTRLRAFLSGDHGVFFCPAQEPGFEWQKITSGGGATAAQSGYGYNPGEILLDVFSVPFSYGYNDWGYQPSGQGGIGIDQQLGLGGDIIPGAPVALKELRAARVRKSSDMMAIMDNTCDSRWDYNVDPRDPYEWPGKIHNKGSNVLFCDGHVTWYAQADLTNVDGPNPAQIAMRRMWNNDNEPH